tara:strand:+ start:68 stop:277 length:210 start_codon:yes stop_codon:yes gene_type:complete
MVNTEENKAARIARQSQMERSIEYFTLMGKKPTLNDLVLTSHILHKYVMDGWTKDMSEMLDKLDIHLQK